MKHLRTTILVAVLLMSTMCNTKPVVLGVTSDGEDDVSTSPDEDSIASRYAPSPRGNTVDSESESIYLDRLPRDLQAIIFEKVGMRTLRSISNIDYKHRRIINDFVEAAEKRIQHSKGNYEPFFDDPGSIMVQLIAAYGKKEVKHALMAQLYEQDLETIQRWLKYAPRNLFLDGQGQFNQKIINVMKDAVVEDYRNLRWFLERFCTCKRDYNACWLQFLGIIKVAINEDYKVLKYINPIICAQDYPHIMRTAERISLKAPQYVHRLYLSTEAYSERMATFLYYWGSKDRCEDWEAYYETAMRVVQHDPSLIYHVSTKNWHRYYSVAREAVRQDGEVLRYVKLLAADPDACEAYYNLANEMVQSRPIAFQYVKLSYGSRGACKAYYDLASKMVQLFPWTIKYVKTRNWETYYDLAMEAVTQDNRVLRYVEVSERHWRRYYDIVRYTVRQDPKAIKYVSTSNQNAYFDAACMALEKNHRVFNDINKNVLTNRQYRYICKAYDEACAWENSLRRRRRRRHKSRR